MQDVEVNQSDLGEEWGISYIQMFLLPTQSIPINSSEPVRAIQYPLNSVEVV